MNDKRIAERETVPERQQTAYHEAGHAAMAFHEDRLVENISIRPEGRSAGVTTLAPLLAKDQFSESDQRLKLVRTEVMILFAGGLAQLFHVQRSTPSIDDEQTLAATMEGAEGDMEQLDRLYSLARIDKASWLTLIKDCHDAVLHTLLEEKFTDAIRCLAESLLARDVLSGEEAHQIYLANVSPTGS